ncbi:MAG: ABC transporter substrate-binding protein [Limnochordia bacterium]|jgi:multiple sugar transport system substrate-binding protein
MERLAHKAILIIVVVTCLGTVTAVAETKLTFPAWAGQAQAKAFLDVIEAFEAANPDVEIEYLQRTGAYYEWIPVLFAAGTPPDVLMVEDRYLRSFVAQGFIVPIDQYVGTAELKRYFPAALAPFHFQGALYGLPRRVNNVATLYNTELFRAAGMPYPAAGWTQADLRAYAKKLTTYAPDQSIAIAGAYFNTPWQQVLPMLWANGGEVFDEEYKTALFDSPANVATLQYLSDLVNVDRSVNLGQSIRQTFAIGQTAIWVCQGAWIVPELRQTAEIEWDVAPMPAGSAGRANIVYASAFCVGSQTKHPEEAVRFVVWASGPEAQRLEAVTPSAVPSIREVATSRAFLDPGLPPKGMRVFLEEMEFARPTPQPIRYADVERVVNSYFGQIWRQTRSGQEGLDELQRIVTAILEESD